MRIGYACLGVGIPGSDFKTCTIKNASEERLAEITTHNLDSLERLIKYNISMKIHLFRISSDLIPFASSPVNSLKWQEMFSEKFQKIGDLIKQNQIRVSMHPGQYTVLNSKSSEVVTRAVEELRYHKDVLNALKVDAENKIVLHIGGIYGDKKSAQKRFLENFAD
jgi:UV DNA damage endonuclease